MPDFRLIPFSNEPPASAFSLDGSVTLDRTVLRAEYVLRGDLRAVSIPESAAQPQRKDGLWRGTCFELFVAPSAQPSYLEINISPSGDWNAYAFSAYREGMAQLAVAHITSHCARRDSSTLEVGFELTLVEPNLITAPCDLAITAVIEHESGAKTYWALAHKGERPDFHRRESFIQKTAS